jgi:hypothetical protein
MRSTTSAIVVVKEVLVGAAGGLRKHIRNSLGIVQPCCKTFGRKGREQPKLPPCGSLGNPTEDKYPVDDGKCIQ